MGKNSKKIAKQTRWWRKTHRTIGIILLFFMFLSGVSGLLLGWKKETALLPKIQKGQCDSSAAWLSIHQMEEIAKKQLLILDLPPSEIARIDIRPSACIAKILFNDNFKELQIDCTTGAVVSVATRKSDIIEKIHDGSIFDYFVKKDTNYFKLSYTTLLSTGLIALSISGFLLWINPFLIRKSKLNSQN